MTKFRVHLWLTVVAISLMFQVAHATPAAHNRTPPAAHTAQNKPATPPTPIVAEVRLPPKSAEEIAAEAADRAEREANDRETAATNHQLVRIGKWQLGVFALQLLVFGFQAFMLLRTVNAANRQSTDMQASIAQATRAATAMETMAVNTAASAQAATNSVAVLKERTALQMRAYLSVVVGEATYQEREKEFRFEARPVIFNSGNTPAHKVRFWAKADILPVPLPPDHAFSDGGPFGGENVIGPHQPTVIGAAIDHFVADNDVDAIKAGNAGRGLYIWGQVKYEDAFGDEHETRFCHHTTWRLNNQIFIYFLAGRNTAT